MYKNSETGYWEHDFRRKGVARLHVSYGVKKRTEAEPLHSAMLRIVREKRTELIDKLRRGDTTVHEIAALIADERPLSLAGAASATAPWPAVAKASDDYVAFLEKSDRKAKGTARAARVQLDRFILYVGAETRVDQVPTATVTAYQHHLVAQEAKQNTVVAYVWRVSGLYSWLVRREKRDAEREKRAPRALVIPIDADEVANRQTHRDHWLTEPEAERLLAATPAPLLAPVMLGLLAGLRIEESLHLRPQHDIDLALGLLTIQEQPAWHPKNRKKRVVPIAPQLRPVLEYHIANYASADWLMPSPTGDEKPLNEKSLWRHFTRIVTNAELVAGRADPRGVVYHTLRHTFASWLVMKGCDLYTLSQLLGNTLAIVERTYAHLAPDFRQRAVDRLQGIVAIPDLPSENATDDGGSGR